MHPHGSEFPRPRWSARGYGRALIFLQALLLLLAAGATPAHEALRAQRGVLDLRQWNPEAQGPVRLDGQWQFHWARLLEPAAAPAEPAPAFAELPERWDDYRLEGASPVGLGYATYRLLILLPPGEQTLALRVPAINSAHRLWANGVLLSRAGRVAAEADAAVAQLLPQERELPAGPDRLELTLQVSNHHHRVGGPLHSLELGTAEQIASIGRRNTLVDLLLVGGAC